MYLRIVFSPMPVFAAAGLALLGPLALAQSPQEVIVEAQRDVPVVVGRTSYGVPVQEVSLRRKVSYAGLNLATPTGAAELERRINETVKASCKELASKYPLTGSIKQDCVKEAVDDAMGKARKLIEAAQAQARGAN